MGVFQALALDFLKRNYPQLYDSVHLNLLRGQLNLQNVDIPPTDPFPFCSFPFQVTSGSIASLMLHVPWTHITSSPIRISAHEVHINFSEPPDSQQTAAFAALLKEAQYQKKRHIIDAEAATTPLVRALRKLLPLMLHHIELDLRDIQLSVHFSNHVVIQLTLDALTTGAPPASTADLAKSFVIDSLSIQISSPPSSPLSISLPRAELALAVANARYDLDLTIPSPVSVHIHASLLEVLRRLSARQRWWHLAASHERPVASVADSPAAWWQYAYRAVSASISSSPPLCRQLVLHIMRACIEYEHLHVNRLRRLGLASEDAKLEELEDLLNADMILLLREHARKHVMAEQVSSFSTNNWLRWTFFKNQMSDEREAIASEIRASLAAVERGDVQTPGLDEVQNCTRARVSLRLANLQALVAGLGEDVRLVISNTLLRAEVESSLDSISVSTSVDDVAVHTGSLSVFRRGLFHRDEVGHAIDSPLIDIRVHKSALDHRLNVEFSIQPACIVLDLHSIRQLLHCIRSFLIESEMVPSCGTIAAFGPHLPDSKTDSIPVLHTLNFVGLINQAEVMITDGGDLKTSSAKEFYGILLRWTASEFRSSPGADMVEIRTSTTLSAKSCALAFCYEATGELSPERGEYCVRPIRYDAFSLSADFSATCIESCLSCTVDCLNANLNLAEAQAFVGLLSSASRIVQDGSVSTISLKENDRDQHGISLTANTVEVPQKALVQEVQVGLTSFMLHIREGADIDREDTGIFLSASNILANNINSNVRISVKMVSITEMVHGGKLSILPTSESRHGIVTCFDNSSTSRSVETNSGHILLKTSAESIYEASRVAEAIHYLVEEVIDFFVILPHGDSVADRIVTRFSVTTKRVQLDLTSPFHIAASLKQVVFSAQGPLLNGSCDRIDIADENGPVPQQSIITRRAQPSESRVVAEKGALSFNAGPGYVNVRVSMLQTSVFRSLILRIERITESLSSLWQSRGLGQDQEYFGSVEATCVSENSTTKWSIQGSNLSFEFAVESSNEGRVRLDLPHITAVFSTQSQIISIRKLSALTKSNSGSNHRSFKSPEHVVGSSATQWSVLLRNLDLDVSHHVHNNDSSDSAHSHRHSWSITFLSRVAAFLAPSQVRNLVSVISQLYGSSDTSSFVSSTVADKDDVQMTSGRSHPIAMPAPSSDSPIFSRTSVRFETQALSIELLNETVSGSVSSTIASMELDPVSFSLTIAKEMGNVGEALIVTTWKGNCPSFRIEDRDPHISPSRQVVIETEESWIGLRGQSDHVDQDDDLSMGLSLEGIVRTDGGKTTSSHQLKVKRARVVLSSRLYMSIADFCNQCAVGSNITGATSGVDGHPGPDKQFISGNRKQETEIPVRKVTVQFVEPVVFLFSVNPALFDCALESHAKSMKATLLFSKGGELMEGSALKIKQVDVFLLWMPELRKTINAPTLSENAIGIKKILDANSDGPVNLKATYSPFGMHGNGSDSSPETRHPTLESVLAVKNATVLFPVHGQKYFTISVPDACVKSSLETFVKTMMLIASLDIGAPEDENAPILCPELRISVNSLSANMKIPTGPELVSTNLSSECMTLRVNVTMDVTVAKDVEAISGKVKVFADVLDEIHNIQDHLISPSSIHFKVIVFGQVSVDVWMEHFIRLTLSPLTARAISGIIFLISEVGVEVMEKPENEHVANTYRHQSRNGSGVPVGVRISINGVIVYCVAEDPRVQLLRLVLRDVKVVGVLPMEANDDGTLEVSIQDLLLEDTVSWRFPWRVAEASDGVEWTKVVVGRQPASNEKPNGYSPSTIQYVMSLIQSKSRQFWGAKTSSHSEGRGDRIEVRTVSSRRNFPLMKCVVKWISPLQQVMAHLDIRGFDFNIDISLFSSLMEWVRSVIVEFEGCKAVRKRGDIINIRVDHIVVEPITIGVSIRAPSKALRTGAHTQLLDLIISADWSDGVEIELPRMVLNGDFFGVDRVFERLEAMYLQKMTSSYFLNQVVWQLPRFARMARVMATVFLRRKEYVLINRVESSAFSTSRNEATQHGVGLLGLLTSESPIIRPAGTISWHSRLDNGGSTTRSTNSSGHADDNGDVKGR